MRPEVSGSDIATAWASAWIGTDPQALARLFTDDATYTDFALGIVSEGRDGVAGWKQGTDQNIANVGATVKASFCSGDRVAIEAVYSGHIKGTRPDGSRQVFRGVAVHEVSSDLIRSTQFYLEPADS